MTRKSKRKLRNRIEELTCRYEPNTDATLLIAPDESFPDEVLPDVSTAGIRAHNEETGRPEVIVPHHRPDAWWVDRIPIVPESVVAAVWSNMDEEQRAREREIREQHDQPMPPVLTEETQT